MSKEKSTTIENESTKPAANEKSAVAAAVKPIPLASQSNPVLNSDGNTSPKASQSTSFIDMLYQQISSVLGGSNSNQFLCLTIPGQALSPEDFAYDYKNNAPKGPVIEANESRLANKLFDPCRVTGGDNGLTLPYQYRAALDMLTPKLNSKVAEAKNQLRELLMTEYPYDFGDGDDKKYTLQEVFFRLYDEWIKASENWSEIQNKKKEDLRKVFPGTDAKSNEEYNNAYLEWYETVAESNLNAINEKMSKVISVFTPNDMKILEGILDSGSGAELQQARQTLTNTQKLNPDGGYVYPVKFNPTNWFEYLNTSFTPIDLLKTPDALAMQMQSLSSRRMKLNARIADISSMIPEQSTVKEAQEKVYEAKKKLDEAKSNIIKEYGNGFSVLLDAVFDIAPLFVGGAVPANIITKLSSGIKFPDGKSISDLIKSINTETANSFNAQQELVNSSQALADASAKAVELQNLANLKNILSPLNEQLDEINAQITELQTQIQLAAVTYPEPDPDTGKVTDKDVTTAAVTPASVPEGYTQVIISADASSLDNSEQSVSSSSVSTSGASFLFGGYHSESSSSASLTDNFMSSSETSIQIGMNVAKVGIEREWFNPGVFALTKDMFNVTSLKIAPNPSTPYTSITDERLKDMATGGSVFPAYPVAMVIARDISVKFVSKSSISSDFSQSVANHASSGGGFLIFSGSSSSHSSSSSSGVHSASADNAITLKFDSPQIIGYYLEATPADRSTYLDDTSGDYQAGYVTISQFVDDYKKMLEAMNKLHG